MELEARDVLPEVDEPMPDDRSSEYEDAGDFSFIEHEKPVETQPEAAETQDVCPSQASQYADAYDDELFKAMDNYLCGSQSAPPPPATQSISTCSPRDSSLSSIGSKSGKRKAVEDPEASMPPTSRRRVSSHSAFTSLDDECLSVSKCNTIASSIFLQRCMDRRGVPYGVQYEIWRLISHGSITEKDISMEQLDKLVESNAISAPLTEPLLKRRNVDHTYDRLYQKEVLAKSPWEELDWEETVLKDDKYAGLGCKPENDNRYGGKVIFGGRLSLEGSQLTVRLERAELGASSRFLRRFGSRQFLRLKVTKEALSKARSLAETLVQFCSRPFILGASVFRAFYAKEDNVFLYCTNETWTGSDIVISNQSTQMPIWDFLQWHNPLSLNDGQSMAKWAARFALGLSNSVPGCMLEPENILPIPDIVSSSGSDMTDGAGYINFAGLQAIARSIGWLSCPTAIQCRAGGGSIHDGTGDAKGMLVLNDADRSLVPKIWVRPSQVKVKHHYRNCEPGTSNVDRAFLSIDVLRASHAHTPSRLSVETIINLAENGVPAPAFAQLIQVGLHAIKDALLKWDGPDAMFDLWCAISEIGGVMYARRGREKVGEARVMGYSYSDNDSAEIDDEEGLQRVQQRSTAWWGDPVSGCPSSLEETAMYLLEAGFEPQTLPVLREKLECIIKPAIVRYIRNYRIDVPMSATAFIIADDYKVLKPGEVYFKRSVRDLKTPDGIDTDTLLGDVIVTRHPCKLPTDAQKWKAVIHPRLLHLTDVIVLPTTGHRRAADYLAGGDYDGDKALIIWQPELVKPFINADLRFADEPASIATAFVRENKKVSEFLQQQKTTGKSDTEVVPDLQKYLLSALEHQSLVGQYSNYHQNAIYMYGYQHKETVRLAYMFCKILDGAKSGQKVTPEQVRKDAKKYEVRSAKWAEKELDQASSKTKVDTTNQPYLSRKKELNLGKFVMDTLHDLAKVEGDLALGQIEKFFLGHKHIVPDADLLKPWKEAEALAKQMAAKNYTQRQEDLNAIKVHVERMYELHRSKMSPRKSSSDTGSGFTDMPIEHRQDILRSLSREFAASPDHRTLLSFSSPETEREPSEVTRLKASYAYHYDATIKGSIWSWSRFPWDVAMRSLCDIKAAARGGHKTLSGDFHQRMQVKKYKAK